jgi:hypothetical protein
MSTNRYTQLSWGTLNDIPLLKLPIEALAGVMAVAEKEKEDFDKLSSLTPKYIKNSKSDVGVANNIRSYQNKLTEDLAEIAAKGNANEYRRSLHDAKKQIADLWAEGGAANALETRYNTWAEMQKQIDKDFENNRRVGNYVKSSYKFGDIEYDPSMRTYKGLDSANYYRDIKDEDVSKWFTENLGVVKETLLNQGVDRRKVDKVNTIHDYFQVTGVPYDKLMEVFQSVMPQDFKNSIYQKAKAEQYYNPNMPSPSPYMYQVEKDKEGNVKTDEQGNVIYKRETVLDSEGKPMKDKQGNVMTMPVPDLSNPLMKLYHGYSKAGTYKKEAHNRLTTKDDEMLEYIRFGYKKLEIDYENQLQTATIYSRLQNTNSGISPIELDKDGNAAPIFQASPLSGTGPFVSKEYLEEKAKEAGKDLLISYARKGEKGDARFPGLSTIYNKIKDDKYFKGLTDKQKSEYLRDSYNNYAEQMQTTDVAVNIPTGKTADRQRANMQATVVGKDGNPGLIGTQTLHIFDPVAGVSNKQMTLEELAIMAGYTSSNSSFSANPDIATAVKNMSWQGTANSDNPFVPSGHYITFKTKQGKIITVMSSPESAELSAIKTPGYVLYSPRHSVGEYSDLTLTGIKEIDEWFGGPIRSRKVIKTQAELLREEKQTALDLLAEGKPFYIDGKEVTSYEKFDTYTEELIKQAEALERNPKENKAKIFMEIYNDRGTRVGGQEDFDEVMKRIQEKAFGYTPYFQGMGQK